MNDDIKIRFLEPHGGLYSPFKPDDAPIRDIVASDDYKLNVIMDDIADEVSFAVAKFKPFNSAHEAYAVLLEEVDELWDEVKAKQEARAVQDMRKEAVQVAAMAIRFILDVCDNGRGQV